MNPRTSPSALGADVRPREVWAWAMYDFANSGYTTVVITAVFSAYFVSVVAAKAVWATLAWTAALSVSYALIMLTAPLVGAWADAHAAKKRLLAISTVGCVAGTALLWFSGPETLAATLVLIVVSNYFFGSGENLIAAFLPELADSDAMGRVSGWGWSIGYLGGILSLGVCLAYITWAQARGMPASDFVPVTMLITAALFAVVSLPTFLFLRERAVPHAVREGVIAASWGRVLQTLREAGRYRDLRRFLVCVVFYQAGIQAVIALAAIYAQEAMHFSTQQTIVLILVVNVTAAVGAFAFGYVQDAIGHVRAVALTLVGWIAMVLTAGMAEGLTAFWIAANIAGVCMGASQAAGRAIVGVLAPPARLGEFFGLWGLAVKLASIFGPLSYGLMTWVFAGDHRTAIMVLGVYFAIGLAILRGVDLRRGRAAALGA
ncbi:MAG: MFS transporter [Betaproteobacteria bacterium]